MNYLKASMAHGKSQVLFSILLLLAFSSTYCVAVQEASEKLNQLIAAQSRQSDFQNALQAAGDTRDSSIDVLNLNQTSSTNSTLESSDSQFFQVKAGGILTLHSSTQHATSAVNSSFTLYSLPIAESDYLDILRSVRSDVTNNYNPYDETDLYTYNTSLWGFHVATVKGNKLDYSTIRDIVKRFQVLATQVPVANQTRVGVVEIQGKSIADVSLYSSIALPPIGPEPTAFNESTDIFPNGTAEAVTYTADAISYGPVPFDTVFLDSFAPFTGPIGGATNPKQRRTIPKPYMSHARNIYTPGSPFVMTAKWVVSHGWLTRTQVYMFRAAIASSLDWLVNSVANSLTTFPNGMSVYRELRSGGIEFHTAQVVFRMGTTVSEQGAPLLPGEKAFQLLAITWQEIATTLLRRYQHLPDNQMLFSQFGEILFKLPDGELWEIGKWHLIVKGHDEL